jgi:hypothetical protein
MVHEFDTSDGCAFLIYAPNGSMKSSFARVFSDISKGQTPKDAIFPQRTTSFSITDETNSEIDPNRIFVVEPFIEDYISDKTSTLMVNKDLRREYEDLVKLIEDKAEKVIAEFGRVSGLRRQAQIQEELARAYDYTGNDTYHLLERIHYGLADEINPGLSDVPYNEIFNEKVLNFLSKNNIRLQLEDYVDRYNELIEKSTYFRRGVFNHNHAANIRKSLDENNYFRANHTISLTDRDLNKREITSPEELDLIIQEEKKRILSDPELASKFEVIDREITRNVDLRNFRNYLENHPEIIPELSDIDAFRKKLWISYSFSIKEELEEFATTYLQTKESIEKIIKAAKEQETKWKRVLSIFQRRFTVPFVLEVANQHDVILKDEAPSLVFKYQDGDDHCEIGRKELMNVLSAGEKRALYLLNIIFEIEARAIQQEKTVLVLDDIADSFDYKNKYAIVEYLKDILETDKFIMLILTHNFDFFRTVKSRLNIPKRRNCFMAIRSDNTVELKQADYQYLKPFSYWRNNLHQDRKFLLASIPMVRNLIEYTEGAQSPDFKFFTSILHRKPESFEITMSELADRVNRFLKTEATYGEEKVADVIFEEAELCLANNDPINLENKVILSMAIRLLAEDIMIFEINDTARINSITSNQTRKLFNICKNMFPEDLELIAVLDRVMLMTPEAIHLNSFMYEPILDMSDDHLKALYLDIKELFTRLCNNDFINL